MDSNNQNINKHSTLVVVTWDGVSEPLKFIHFDASANFDILLFDYSGEGKEIGNSFSKHQLLLSKKTENKGQVYLALYNYLNDNKNLNYSFIGIMDDDLLFNISEFNYMLKVAELHNLHVFQPSIAKDSYFSHRQFVHQSGVFVTKTKWIEMMAPFYDIELFNAAAPYFPLVNSGQGIDLYLMPCLQLINNKNNTAIVHTATIKHCRPIRSHLRLYSNGLTGDQEIELIRQKAIQLVGKQEYSNLFDSTFRRQILKEGNRFVYLTEKYLLSFKNLWFSVISRLKEYSHFS